MYLIHRRFQHQIWRRLIGMMRDRMKHHEAWVDLSMLREADGGPLYTLAKMRKTSRQTKNDAPMPASR